MTQAAFLLFRNPHVRRPGDPEYVGSITAGGVNYRIEARVVEHDAGKGERGKHFEGTVRASSTIPRRSNSPQLALDDGAPFNDSLDGV